MMLLLLLIVGTIAGADDSVGFFVEPTVVVVKNPQHKLMMEGRHTHKVLLTSFCFLLYRNFWSCSKYICVRRCNIWRNVKNMWQSLICFDWFYFRNWQIRHWESLPNIGKFCRQCMCAYILLLFIIYFTVLYQWQTNWRCGWPTTFWGCTYVWH